jgi:hypothetical protein
LSCNCFHARSTHIIVVLVLLAIPMPVFCSVWPRCRRKHPEGVRRCQADSHTANLPSSTRDGESCVRSKIIMLDLGAHERTYSHSGNCIGTHTHTHTHTCNTHTVPVRPTQRDNVNVLASETQVHHGIHAHMGSPRVCVPRLLQPCLMVSRTQIIAPPQKFHS